MIPSHQNASTSFYWLRGAVEYRHKDWENVKWGGVERGAGNLAENLRKVRQKPFNCERTRINANS